MQGAPLATTGVCAVSRSRSASPSQNPAVHPFLPRTPVVSAVTNSYNLSTVPLPPPNTVPWTPDEHLRFLNALEQFGGLIQHPQATWEAITQSVRTRTIEDVKVHANWYFIELQRMNAQRLNEHLAMQAIDARWTLEEDALFEHLLAVHAGVAESACFPWELIASKLPDKSPRDVQERYHKLCYDIARIETGHHVSMNLCPRHSQRAMTGADGPEVALCSWDCVVTLTAEEEAILRHSAELVRVPPGPSPQVLANIGAAMEVLMKPRNKIPPQRASALFTLDEARAAFEELLFQLRGDEQQQQQHDNQDRGIDADPRPVLDVLVRRLRLLPTPGGDNQLEHSAFTDPTPNSGSGHHQVPALRPLATAGFAFGDAPTYSSVQFVGTTHPKADVSQRGAVAEDLPSFRKLPPQQLLGPASPFVPRTPLALMLSPVGGAFAFPLLPSPSFSPPPPLPTLSSRPGSSARSSGDPSGAGVAAAEGGKGEAEEIRESEPLTPPSI